MTFTDEEKKLIRNLLVDYKNQLLREELREKVGTDIVLTKEDVCRLLKKFRREE